MFSVCFIYHKDNQLLIYNQLCFVNNWSKQRLVIMPYNIKVFRQQNKKEIVDAALYSSAIHIFIIFGKY